jgi:hypothetical protein
MPGLSANRINMQGLNFTDGGNSGVVAMSPFSHAVISQNAAPQNAYQWIMGHEGADYIGNTATDTATATSLTGMSATTTFFSGAGDMNLLTFRFSSTGASSDAWSLGTDTLGVNWWGNGGSTIEERIYAATPANVEATLCYNGTAIISFGYTPIYMLIDYKTTDLEDDEIKAYSDPVAATKLSGLSGDADNLANALIADITAAGGLAQLNLDTFQTATRQDIYQVPGYGIFSFTGSIMAVPEPSTWALMTSLVAFGFVLIRRRKS